MFNFSSKTIVNREYKLKDFLTQINASKEVKEDAKKIEKICFQNVINSQTLNVDEDKDYKNIYVFKINLKSQDIPTLFIEQLDKSIAFHTYFIFEYDNKVSTYIAYKNIGKKITIDSKYYGHPFDEDKTIELPVITSLKDVYKVILEYEINIKSRTDETPEEYIKRVKQINKLEFQISKTTSAIKFETQPKKKFEYNDRLRKYKKELEELKMEEK